MPLRDPHVVTSDRRRLWTGLAPDRVHADFDALTDWAFPFAQDSLERWGDLAPFARTLDTQVGGRIVATAAGDTAGPGGADPVQVMIDDVRRRRASLRAVALCYEVLLRGVPGDAIRLDIEHRTGVAVTVLKPYVRRRLGRGFRYEPLRAMPSKRRIWP